MIAHWAGAFIPKTLASLVGVFSVFTLASAEVELLRDARSLTVFASAQTRIELQFRNTATASSEVALQYKLFQLSSGLAAPVGGAKSLGTVNLPASETVLKLVTVELPPVSAETRFQVIWFNHDRKLGTANLSALPRDILSGLTGMGGNEAIGVIDPESQFRPALATLKPSELKEAEDISSAEVTLILVAPMSPKNRPAGLNRALKKKAARGAGIILLQAAGRGISPNSPDPLYALPEGAGRIVVAPAALCADLANSPQAQQNLLMLARIASGQRKLELPADPTE
ncbi:MAG: hypothetical protein JWM16_1297 [Verrucomicrobiales bacterium]|nr:hypothetical protein [Verrucomicrobiales bacterium]